VPISTGGRSTGSTYCQNIPPYHLRQRSRQGQGPDTARLLDFVSRLNLSQYPVIANWKLELATSGAVNIQ
jgi:hypothetical protein